MKKPQQTRALRTREKILKALETLLADHEFEAIAISDIAKTAGVAVGSVYSHFEDKSALLPALLERRMEAVEARIEAYEADGTIAGVDLNPPEGMSLKARVDLLVRLAYRQVRDDRGTLRALLTYRRLHPKAAADRSTAFALRAFDGFVLELEQYRDEIGHQDLREAAVLVNYFVNVVFLDEAMFIESPLPDPLTPSEDMKLKAYAQMIYAYLTHDPDAD